MFGTSGQLESMSAEKAKKIKDQFEKKLTDLQTDLKKMQAAKRDHSKLLKNQSHYEKQFKTLQHELQEMKKTKVEEFISTKLNTFEVLVQGCEHHEKKQN